MCQSVADAIVGKRNTDQGAIEHVTALLDFQPEIVRSPVDVLGTDVSGEKPSEEAVAEASAVQECPGLPAESDVDRPRRLDTRFDNSSKFKLRIGKNAISRRRSCTKITGF